MEPPSNKHRKLGKPQNKPDKPKPRKPKSKSGAPTPSIIWNPAVVDGWGVVTGCDSHHEWMLPWWFSNYTRYNRYPVYFADFGMSKAGAEWCNQHGSRINLTFWGRRRNWFKKPLAILGCPFKRTIWLDLDCEIRGDITPMFSYVKKGIAVTLDPHNPWVKTKPVIASGIVGVRYGHPLILKWGKQCMGSHKVRGDQEVLNQIIHTKRDQLAIMPPEYQWLRIDGDNPNALVMHWTGVRGKDHIRQKLGLPPVIGQRYRSSIKHRDGVKNGRGGTGRSKRKRGVISIIASNGIKKNLRARVRKVENDISLNKKKRK